MRLIQALAISIPSWIFLYFALYEGELYIDDWPDFLLVLVIILVTISASLMAFLRCDMRIVFSRSPTEQISDNISSRANLAFLLTGLALGLLPTLIWSFRLIEQNDDLRDISNGVPVIITRNDLEAGDIVTMEDIMGGTILRKNLTNSHYYYMEADKIIGAKVRINIPAQVSIISEALEGVKAPPEVKNGLEVKFMKDLGD